MTQRQFGSIDKGMWKKLTSARVKSKPPAPKQYKGGVRKGHVAVYRKPVPTYRPRSLFDLLREDERLNLFLALSYICVLLAVLFAPSVLFEGPRWQAVSDLNRDGLFSVTDLFLWCFWLFYLPGDVVISVLLQFQAPTQFFELYGESYGGLGSLVLSSLFWWSTGGLKMLLFWLTPIVIQTYLRG